MRRFFLITITALWLSSPFSLWGRLRVSPGWENVRDLAEHAPWVFRGEVVGLQLTKDGTHLKEGKAVIAVDRWYRGSSSTKSPTVSLHFSYSEVMASQGHDCVDLLQGSHWIFFAQTGDASGLELFHDCEGALAVSALLARNLPKGFLAQIESDFMAGLADSDPAARIASIQRLAGLRLASSRDALHEVIAHGGQDESKWALFAALETGDVSVLPLSVPLLLNLRHDNGKPYAWPEAGMALAIQKLRAVEAVPELIQILNEAPDDLVRSCVSQALSEIKDPRALEAFARHLSDSSQYVRYNSLVGMQYLTHAPACTAATPEDAENVEPLCKKWWTETHPGTE